MSTIGVQYNFNWDLYPHPRRSTQPISCPSGRSTGAASQNLRLGVSPSCPGNGLDDPLTGHETETQVSNFDLMLWRLRYSWRTGLYVYWLYDLTPPPTPANDCPTRKLAPNISILEKKNMTPQSNSRCGCPPWSQRVAFAQHPSDQRSRYKRPLQRWDMESEWRKQKWQRMTKEYYVLVFLQSLVTSINPTKRLTNLAKTLCHLRIKKSPMFGAAAITRTSM